MVGIWGVGCRVQGVRRKVKCRVWGEGLRAKDSAHLRPHLSGHPPVRNRASPPPSPRGGRSCWRSGCDIGAVVDIGAVGSGGGGGKRSERGGGGGFLLWGGVWGLELSVRL